MAMEQRDPGPGRVMRSGYGDAPGRPIPENNGELVREGQIRAQKAGKHIGRPMGKKSK